MRSIRRSLTAPFCALALTAACADATAPVGPTLDDRAPSREVTPPPPPLDETDLIGGGGTSSLTCVGRLPNSTSVETARIAGLDLRFLAAGQGRVAILTFGGSTASPDARIMQRPDGTIVGRGTITLAPLPQDPTGLSLVVDLRQATGNLATPGAIFLVAPLTRTDGTEPRIECPNGAVIRVTTAFFSAMYPVAP